MIRSKNREIWRIYNRIRIYKKRTNGNSKIKKCSNIYNSVAVLAEDKTEQGRLVKRKVNK